ncbi:MULTISPECIES: FAD-dependent monooxygenase [unclassified Streptomyces]|uniref:FAD-dependent monooxygenase n=2 Tax=unclassified Streptomyces TaxID=2593676 RepID=UPI00324DC0E9
MTTDVTIVGGGPNGLLLACELRLAGVRPLLLERLHTRSATPRANGLVGRVVQALELRGLYEPLTGRSGPAEPLPFYQFSGLPLDLRDLRDNPLHALQVPQARIEQVLEERARQLGVEIRRGHELTALHQDDDAVTLDIRAPQGAYRIRTRYLVGADGGHSTVRKQAGIVFPGITDDSFVSRAGQAIIPDALLDPATGELDLPEPGMRLRPYTHNRLPGGVLTFAMMQPGSGIHLVATFEWDQPPADDSTPMTFDELRASARRVLGTDLPMSPPSTPGPHLLRRLTGTNSRQADTYRAGRVLLLGDAAHVHSAVGGPGLNLGMQDAINLGWKLAAQIHGWAPPELLDTYHSERAPVSRRVLMQTRAQMALMRPAADITAARDLLVELLDDPRNRARIAALLSGTDIRYDMGHDTTHPLTGRWLPDLRTHITDGWTQIAERLRAARPVLVDLTGNAATAQAARAWTDRVDVITARSANRSLPASAILVRPDGYLAWATDDTAGQSMRHHLHAALTTWFGAAT